MQKKSLQTRFTLIAQNNAGFPAYQLQARRLRTQNGPPRAEARSYSTLSERRDMARYVYCRLTWGLKWREWSPF